MGPPVIFFSFVSRSLSAWVSGGCVLNLKERDRTGSCVLGCFFGLSPPEQVKGGASRMKVKLGVKHIFANKSVHVFAWGVSVVCFDVCVFGHGCNYNREEIKVLFILLKWWLPFESVKLLYRNGFPSESAVASILHELKVETVVLLSVNTTGLHSIILRVVSTNNTGPTWVPSFIYFVLFWGLSCLSGSSILLDCRCLLEGLKLDFRHSPKHRASYWGGEGSTGMGPAS